MHFSRKKPEEETLLLTPFVDIVLNLLIFFAVTSQFDIAWVRIRLPQVSKVIAGQLANKATVVIDSSGQAYFEGKQIDMKHLEQRLKSLVQEKGNLQLVLQADKDVAWHSSGSPSSRPSRKWTTSLARWAGPKPPPTLRP